MTLEAAIDEAREEGLVQGRKRLVCDDLTRNKPDLISEMTVCRLKRLRLFFPELLKEAVPLYF